MEKCAYLVMMAIVSTTIFAGPIVTISNVQVSPGNPSIADLITLEVDGYIPGGGIALDASTFTANELSLQLDLYFTDQIGTQVPKIWFHDEGIGYLLSGVYDLKTQAYWRTSSSSSYILQDDYVVTFQVIPEPTTISLLSFGLLMLRKRKQI